MKLTIIRLWSSFRTLIYFAPIHLASAKGYADIVALLLQKDTVDINAVAIF